MEALSLVSKTNYKVYTPKKIARKMVASIFKEYFKGDKREKLNKFRGCDISCGTGNLLLVLLESLIRISKIFYGQYKYDKNWIEGFDIDEDALVHFEKRFRKLLGKYELEGELRIFHENSLFLENKKKYNVVIGNPPYLGEKNNRAIFDKIRKTTFGSKYYEGRMDYLYFFIEKGIDILEEGGVLSYITTNYWLRADYAKKLRKKIKDEVSFTYIKNYNKSVFKNVHGQHNIIFTFVKMDLDEFWVEDGKEKFCSDNKLIFDRADKLVLAPKEKLIYFDSILKKSNYYLGDILNINQGIVSGCDKAFVMEEYKKEYGDYLRPFYKNSDIDRYKYNKKNSYWILYLNKDSKPSKELIAYLSEYREKLMKRREVKKGLKKWWELQWGRKENIFTEAKIIAPQRSISNNFALVEDEFYSSADIYYLTAKKEDLNLYYILAYLNSGVFYEWFRHNGKNKGDYLELYATPLKAAPIYYPDNKDEVDRIGALAESLTKKYSKIVEAEIEKYFRNIFEEK